jgi:LmbE family N-acetylglucosaminyl deacetylase
MCFRKTNTHFALKKIIFQSNFMQKTFYFLILSLFSFSIWAQTTPPRVLIINAHPDDESGCAATIYKITHELGGMAELAVVTNGEAGYKYSLLAEEIYGVPLTTEAVGRKYLPKIRKKELAAGCKWVGINKIYHFDQLDTHYTLDVDTVLKQVWKVDMVKQKLAALIQKNHYQYIFCLLPVPETHGHHKAASILALEVVKSLPAADRPVIMGVSGGMKSDTSKLIFRGLPAYPITKVSDGTYTFETDRTQSFGFKNKLNYKIVVNWLIAEHKSQGTMQTYMGQGDYERFWLFDENAPDAKAKAEKLFAALKTSLPKNAK